MTKDQIEASARAAQSFKEARLKAALSQEDLALEAGLDQSTISKVERVGPQEMGWSNVFKLASALGCVVEIRLSPIVKA